MSNLNFSLLMRCDLFIHRNFLSSQQVLTRIDLKIFGSTLRFFSRCMTTRNFRFLSLFYLLRNHLLIQRLTMRHTNFLKFLATSRLESSFERLLLINHCYFTFCDCLRFIWISTLEWGFLHHTHWLFGVERLTIIVIFVFALVEFGSDF